jgi:hypothetical protein
LMAWMTVVMMAVLTVASKVDLLVEKMAAL